MAPGPLVAQPGMQGAAVSSCLGKETEAERGCWIWPEPRSWTEAALGLKLLSLVLNCRPPSHFYFLIAISFLNGIKEA